jgi:N-acetylglucosamine-6-phosphate deacetylase
MLISDAIAAAGLGDGDYKIWGESISVTKGRTRNARGNLAGSVITLLEAFRTIGQLGVSEVAQALIASFNPAKLIGVEKDCGSIAIGKRADLIALDKEKNIVLAMVNGSVAVSSA